MQHEADLLLETLKRRESDVVPDLQQLFSIAWTLDTNGDSWTAERFGEICDERGREGTRRRKATSAEGKEGEGISVSPNCGMAGAFTLKLKARVSEKERPCCVNPCQR